MGRVYRFLGLTSGVILSGQTPAERREQYACDITYGTNNEFGFDYLRDNMAWSTEELVQRGHNYAIVDEVDSILIDEARTPLIISGPASGDANRWYAEFAKVARRLQAERDYEVDEKKRTVGVLESGIERVEDYLGIDNLYESLNTPLIGFLNNAIKAKELFKRDKDYVVLNGEVLIVDEHTGRILAGRRYNEGMHQAIEAKEGVAIKAENQTLATITLQNYFRLYSKLAGMTGTAETEAAEFQGTYKLGVVPIPTNRPMQRIDQGDLVYKAEDGKFDAVVADIVERHAHGQPVLVGTTSVEKSELLSAKLKKQGVPHEVLNAKQHAREASIVAQAGRKGAVTVATNMAGRGTDIMLGGNAEFMAIADLAARGLNPAETPEEYEAAWPSALEKATEAVKAEHDEVVELGGLYVLGTERHESRRIDNQLRGRSGRQGDPGESRFYLSLQDDLMRLFNSQMAESLMTRAGFPDDLPLESKMVTRGIQSAQSQVEARNFEIRKNVLKYDDVLSRQRSVIYAERQHPRRPEAAGQVRAARLEVGGQAAVQHDRAGGERLGQRGHRAPPRRRDSSPAARRSRSASEAAGGSSAGHVTASPATGWSAWSSTATAIEAKPGVTSPSSRATPSRRVSVSSERSAASDRGPVPCRSTKAEASGNSARTCAAGSAASTARPLAVSGAGSRTPTSVTSGGRPGARSSTT